MKTSPRAQSATSLPQAPRDDAGSRLVKYIVMMGIRFACFGAMFLVTPYGWYTFLFAAGAIFLPYLAVVVANVGQDAATVDAVNPERMIEAAPAAPVSPSAEAPTVIRIAETARLEQPRDDRS
ncbi:DUF3099 domain-containing protein [Microbacterium sp. IEGM 1404]|uniref:DUF3099 domain-containing protein n=1 Tax=Microbacterium sp. IEGM 1404 TaxID=3047084 RepID=UPI0024B788A7|nr:DUF3099 domain-containing protein [Microbacterium sp. IEGM 1404]MDI9890579.1 DUF3099 domain-containing protein [Microbacterium sp. IEGM 1404]